MNSIQEIDKKIEAMNRLIANTTGKLDAATIEQAKLGLEKLMSEKAELEANGETNNDDDKPIDEVKNNEKPSSKVAKINPKKTDDGESLRVAILATLREIMSMSPESALDSEKVNLLITEYLDSSGVKLKQLSTEVIDEIKRNQKVVIQIPGYDLNIKVDKNTAEIPNIYSIIDDVLAGNNVWLVGKAGTGKTYAAEKVAEILQREVIIINCSQYTSPNEIIGGPTIIGYVDGKLIIAWRDGKLLLLDEISKLDSNTAGLLNDALAKSSKTRKAENAKISSANPQDKPIERNKNFGLIATSNIYPNRPPQGGYVGNNQQDLSLLDRFSGSVYEVGFSKFIDQDSARYNYLYDFLVGDYYEYTEDVKNDRTPTKTKGLRTLMERNNYDNLALVSYRTIVAFRVAFEIELVRAMAKKAGHKIIENGGKTVRQTFENYLVAFPEDAKKNIVRETMTPERLERETQNVIDGIVNGGPEAFRQYLTPSVAQIAGNIMESMKTWIVAENFITD